MKSISSLFCCGLLALGAAGCWVPSLPDTTVFACDTAEDCAQDGVLCAPPKAAGERGYCCTPSAEVCNGADDNCNGVKDDLAVSDCYGGPTGTLGKGICKAGKPACGANGAVVCEGEVRPAASETCNGKDDNCDGTVDEGFNLQSDIANCGTCGNLCNAVTQQCLDGSCQKRQELDCTDGLDNDGDGAKDCVDSDCSNQSCGPTCICIGGKPGEAVCSDNIDNDGDTDKDCADTDCAGKSCGTGCLCQSFTKTETACGDNTDNDGDTLKDCADVDCSGASCGTGCSCQGSAKVETVCNDDTDNDGDTLKDCADTADCNGKECGIGGCTCQAGNKVEVLCGDGLDNDGDSKADCADPDCDGKNPNTSTLCSGGAKVEIACTDSTDNDGNGKIDCVSGNSDPNCVSGTCGAGCAFNNCGKKETNCSDRVDNDGDTSVDCADKQDCPVNTACTRTNGTAGKCQNNGSCA